MEQENFTGKFRYFLAKSLSYHAVQKAEGFDPASLSMKDIDIILAEREVWELLRKKAEENPEEQDKISPILSYIQERLDTINGLLKRLAN